MQAPKIWKVGMVLACQEKILKRKTWQTIFPNLKSNLAMMIFFANRTLKMKISKERFSLCYSDPNLELLLDVCGSRLVMDLRTHTRIE